MHNIDIKNGKSDYGRDLRSSSSANQTERILKDFSYHQASTFRDIAQKVDDMESNVGTIEKSIINMEQKIRNFMETVNNGRLSKIKDKQTSFIINQLKQKIAKLQADNQKLQASYLERQQQCLELISANQRLLKQNVDIAAENDRKCEQIKQLLNVTKALKSQRDKVKTPEQNSPTFKKVYQFQKLEIQLKDLQARMEVEINEYKNKNNQLQGEISRLKNGYEEDTQTNNNRYTKRVYELEFKVNTLEKDNKQLEELYQSALQKSQQSELDLHKKITEFKATLQKEKKEMKNYRAEVQKNLMSLVQNISQQLTKTVQQSQPSRLSKAVLVGKTTTTQQFQQIQSILVKQMKRMITSLKLQNSINLEQKKLELDSKQTTIANLTTNIESLKQKLEKQKQKNSNSVNVNGHMISKNKSIGSEDNSNNRSTEQKKGRDNTGLIAQLRTDIESISDKLLKERQEFDQQEAKLREELLENEQKNYQLAAQLDFSKQEAQARIKQAQQLALKSKQQSEEAESKREQRQKYIEEQTSSLRLQLLNKEDELRTAERKVRGLEKKMDDIVKKNKTKQQKANKVYQDLKKTVNNKEKMIEELISKNQGVNIESKLIKEKNKILEFTLQELKDKVKQYQIKVKTQKTVEKDQDRLIKDETAEISQLGKKIEILQAQVLEEENQKNIALEDCKFKSQRVASLQDQLTQSKSQMKKLEFQIKSLQNTNTVIKESLEKYKQQMGSDNSETFARLKRQYNNNLEISENKIRELNQKIGSITSSHQRKVQGLKKEIEKSSHSIKNLKQEFEKKEQELTDTFDILKVEQQEKYRKIVQDYDAKVEALTGKIQQLEAQQKTNNSPISGNDIIPQKQQEKMNLPPIKRFKPTCSIEYKQQAINTTTSLNEIITSKRIDAATNTQNQSNPITGNSFQKQNSKILNDSLGLSQSNTKVNISKKQQPISEMRNSNLFHNLDFEEGQEQNAFEICDEDQAINYGQGAINLQIRQLFNTMRTEIQKLFNQEQISMSMIKILPPALQDDYYEFTAYVKEKIADIKQHNEISFIMAEPGHQPEQLEEQSLDLPEIIDRHRSQVIDFRRVLEEKEALIMSLMTQKNSQENTINQLTQQKEEFQQQNQNRFMNQCNIYKKEIKEHKKMLDTLQMKFQSLKNVIKNILETYSNPDDMEDDFRDSMTVYARMAKLNQKQRTRINYHIQRYRQIKGLQ